MSTTFEVLAERNRRRILDLLISREHAVGELVTVSEAVVKLNVGGEAFHNVGTGNGPVNALDQALRKDLGRYSSHLQDLRLVDYKVRILTGGTKR